MDISNKALGIDEESLKAKKAEKKGPCKRLGRDTPRLKEEQALIHKHKMVRKKFERDAFYMTRAKKPLVAVPSLSKNHPNKNKSVHGAYIKEGVDA